MVRSLSPVRRFGPRSVIQLLLFGCFVLFQYHFFSRVTPKSSTQMYVDGGGDSVSRPYDRLIQAHKNGIPSSYTDKCTSYFDLLYNEDAAWGNGDFNGLPYTRRIFESQKRWVEDRVKEWKNDLKGLSDDEKNKKADEENIADLFTIKYKDLVKESRATEQKMAESATHLRVYGACFLDQYGDYNKATVAEKDSTCHDIENRLFQWLSGRSPIFRRWDGTKLLRMPIMSDYVEGQIVYPDDTSAPPPLSACYMKTIRDSFNGRGLVISAADAHVEQLVSLFAVLRASGNTLPIQIVHSGDLSEDSQQLLIKVARSITLNLKHVDNLDDVLAQRNLTIPYDQDVLPSEMEILFPPQELWFVDISDAVSKVFRSKFKAYANKLLAYFFSSFQHTVLIDTDTVPVANIDKHILRSPFYEKHRAFFFKDRELHVQNQESDVRFFQKLLPTQMDQVLFGISPITDKTMTNRFFKYKFQHLQESGVVAIDKKRHFTGVLSTLQLQIWSPASTIVWGDKELFWLGMSMAGDEDYYMNHWAAGSVGFVTPTSQRLSGDGDDTRRNKLIGKEVCSTHPAHMSPWDNSTLLWYNSGFSYCKKDGAYKSDFNKGNFKNVFGNEDEMKMFYEGYHHIEAVIVPKHGEFFRRNNEGENQRGWLHINECKHFLFCAYDKVGGVDDPESNGLLVEFDEQTKKTYNFYGSCAQFASEIFGLS